MMQDTCFGSSIIELWITENGKTEKIVFTGDLGNNDIPLLSPPTMISDADYLVMESTYGNRLHMRNDDKAKIFLDIVYENFRKRWNSCNSSFAVGRTQEILFELNRIKEEKHDEDFYKKYKKLMSIPVYVDSPLAISATEVFKENMDLFNEETQKIINEGDNPLEFAGLKFTRTADESKALNASQESSIIISASGMCEVGRIKHHLKHHLWEKNSTILFVGYQAPGTLGRKLVDGAKEVKIFGEEIAVNARIEYIEGYSGHADQEWLLNFVYSFTNPPKHIFLVHGEPEGQVVLKEKLEENTNIPITIPDFGESYELDENIEMVGKVKDTARERYLRLEVLERMNTLKEELEDMSNIVKEEYLEKNAADSDIVKIKDRLKELENQIVKIVENK